MSRETRPTSRAPPRHLSASILSLATSYGTALVAIALTSVLIARLLGSSGIGVYAIASALLWLSAILFDLGIGQGTAYYVARREWRGSDMSLGVVRACAVLGGIGAGATLLAFELLGHLVPGMDWLMAGALAAAIPFALVWRIAPQAALADERFELFALFNSFPALLACPLSVGLALIGGVTWAVVGLAVAFVLTGSVIAVWLLREGHRQRAESRSPAGGTLAVVSFGARAWLSELLQQLNLRADLIMLGAFAGAAASGVYSVALATTGIAWQLTEALAVSVLPRSARLHAESERKEIRSADRDQSDSRVMRHAVLAIPAIATLELLLLLVGIPIFYGPGFHGSIGLGLILLVGSLAFGVGRTALAVVLARGFPNRLVVVGLAVVPASLVAYVLVLPTAGATGAAVVSTCSYLAYSLIGVGFMRATTGIHISAILLPRRFDLDDYRVSLQNLRRALHLRRPTARSGWATDRLAEPVSVQPEQRSLGPERSRAPSG